MGRIGRGWDLTKRSWAVVKADRSLLVFPIIAAAAGIVVAGVFFGAGAGVVAASDKDWAAIPFVVVGLYLLILIGTFCNVALAACATRALEGEDTTVSEGVAAARAKFGAIVAWAGVQLVVSAVVAALQAVLREGAGQLVSSIVGGLANLAWTVASFFVIPAIALEGLQPMAALKRSTSIIRQRWGEGVVGTAAIGGIVFLVGILPGGALIAGGVAASKSSAGLAAALIVVGACIIVTAALIQSTLTVVFKVALYRFATEERVIGGFERHELENAFAPRRRGRRGLA
ncbi:MAG TPA: DUF6159 family protein [Solirubrobacteraceae bacterium]